MFTTSIVPRFCTRFMKNIRCEIHILYINKQYEKKPKELRDKLKKKRLKIDICFYLLNFNENLFVCDK